MGLSEIVVAFAIVAIVILGSVFVFATGAEESADLDFNKNETTSVTLDQWNELEDSNRPDTTYKDDETVLNETGTELTEGSDYEWNTSTGEIRPLSSSPSTTSTLTVEYNYTGPSDGSVDTRPLVSFGLNLNSIILILGGAFTLIGALILLLAVVGL